MPSDASKISLLLVDDDPSFLTLFVQSAKAGGKGGDFEITTAASGEEALEKAGLAAPDVVVSDVQMPGMDGLALFSRIADRFPGLPVILLTAYSSVDRAVEAIKMGAYHYFSKPVTDLDLFWNTVEAAAAFKRQNDELAALRWERRRLGDGEEMVGRSPAWRRVVDSLTRVAPLPSTVLITGETGTGKEVVARNIHRLSPRTDRPFIAVSCLEFAGTLLETELFGHEKGAFTGAVARKRGIFERAHGGTLFLDEIAETSMEIQGKLLRVLEGSPFHRVGGQEPLRSDFRLIAATNRDVKAEVAAGRFRQDLYFRLAVYPIHLPPLRERPEDIFILATHFLEQKAHKIGRPPLNLSGAALLALNQHVWPGNVRELENLIERAVIVSTGDDVLPGDLFPEQAAEMGWGGGLRLEDMERMLIQLALQRSGHNKSQAAEMLGISRKTLGEKLNRLNIS